MALELVTEAERTFVRATDGLNHVRRDVWFRANAELSTIARGKNDTVIAIEAGRYSETLMGRLLDLKAREKKLQAMMAEGPATVPDVHPNIAQLYVRKVARLSEALARPEDRDEAADAIRSLIERVALLPGEIHATLHGEFGAMLEWVPAREVTDAANNNTPGAGLSGVFTCSPEMMPLVG